MVIPLKGKLKINYIILKRRLDGLRPYVIASGNTYESILAKKKIGHIEDEDFLNNGSPSIFRENCIVLSLSNFNLDMKFLIKGISLNL